MQAGNSSNSFSQIGTVGKTLENENDFRQNTKFVSFLNIMEISLDSLIHCSTEVHRLLHVCKYVRALAPVNVEPGFSKRKVTRAAVVMLQHPKQQADNWGVLTPFSEFWFSSSSWPRAAWLWGCLRVEKLLWIINSTIHEKPIFHASYILSHLS